MVQKGMKKLVAFKEIINQQKVPVPVYGGPVFQSQRGSEQGQFGWSRSLSRYEGPAPAPALMKKYRLLTLFSSFVPPLIKGELK